MLNGSQACWLLQWGGGGRECLKGGGVRQGSVLCWLFAKFACTIH